MKLTGWISTAALSLTFAASIAMYAQEQHDQQEEKKEKPAEQKEKKTQPAKPAKQEERSTEQRNDAKQQEQKSTAQHNDAKQREQKSTEQHNDAKQQERTAQQQNKNAEQQDKTAKHEQQVAHQQQQHDSHAAPEQQAHHGGRIPDDRFRAHFGQEHRFHVTQANYSSHRFQYGGYWFGFVDPWPTNWLYTQDVYVVDIDGVYYLCNAMYPGVNIALNVTL
jgi:outer membrane biosynthesis protein TonB